MNEVIEKIMALADDYAKAWHANQSSRMVAAYDDGSHRQALRTALEQALAAKPVGYWLVGTTVVEFDQQDYHSGPEWEPIYTAPPARVDGWQPIETTPKDGCMFLGYAPPPDGVPQVIHAKTYWQSVADGAPRYMPVDECKALTHWMPLPPAPQPTKD